MIPAFLDIKVYIELIRKNKKNFKPNLYQKLINKKNNMLKAVQTIKVPIWLQNQECKKVTYLIAKIQNNNI